MFLLYALGLITSIIAWNRLKPSSKRALVVVLGDIGRSPRMQNHCLSLVQHHYKIDFLGYSGSEPILELSCNPNIKFHYLNQPQSLGNTQNRLIYIMQGIIRVLLQSLKIFSISFTIPKPRFILIQNPPAIPTLLLFQLTSWVLGVKLIIDWHNFGFSIMALSKGKNDPIVKLARRYVQIDEIRKVIGELRIWAYHCY